MVAGSYGPYGAFTTYRPPGEGFFIPPAMRVVADWHNLDVVPERLVSVKLSELLPNRDSYAAGGNLSIAMLKRKCTTAEGAPLP